MKWLKQGLTYPDGQVPCKCCGVPLGTNGAGMKYNRTCYDCRKEHNNVLCAAGRDSCIKTNWRLQLGK